VNISVKLSFWLAIALLLGVGCRKTNNGDIEHSVPAPQGFVYVSGGVNDNGAIVDTVRSVFMAIYEVTQSDYKRIMGKNPSFCVGDSTRPVDSVTWFDAIEYCNRRSIKEGLAPCYIIGESVTDPSQWPLSWRSITKPVRIVLDTNANGYRLPTQAEWESAAQGKSRKTAFVYAGSDDVEEVSWYHGNTKLLSSAVGGKKANDIGLFDMSGNVWEWCWDNYGERDKIRRGGGYTDNAEACALTNQSSEKPEDKGMRKYILLRGGTPDTAVFADGSGFIHLNPSTGDPATGFRVCRNAADE